MKKSQKALNKLSENEIDALLHLADETKADWLMICEYNKVDVFVDTEECLVLDLSDGVATLAEYVVEPYNFYGLTNEEIALINGVFSRFNAIPNFRYYETDDE